VSGGSDMNIAPWLSRATLDMSVSSLRYVTTLCTSKLTLSQLSFRIGRGLLADLPREVNGVLTLSIQLLSITIAGLWMARTIPWSGLTRTSCVWMIHHPGRALRLIDRVDRIRKNASGTGSTIELLVQSCFQYLPEFLLAPLIAKMPGEVMNQMRENQKIVHGLARGWIADKSRALEVGKGHRDIMTLLGG
jgi:hypothetical protein